MFVISTKIFIQKWIFRHNSLTRVVSNQTFIKTQMKTKSEVSVPESPHNQKLVGLMSQKVLKKIAKVIHINGAV